MKKKAEKITRLVIPKSKNSDILFDFVSYCVEHKELRFWQALRNWSCFSFIYGSDLIFSDLNLKDTFYFEGKDK